MDSFLLKAQDYIPKNLRNTTTFVNVADIFNSLLSNSGDLSRTNLQIYSDIIYYNKDIARLSYEVKRAKLNDLGFSYLLDVFEPTDLELNGLLTFFNLIRALKARTEGLELILATFNIPYELTMWDETEPKGEIFTGALLVKSELSQALDLVSKVQNLTRNYMAPLIYVTVESIDEVAYQNMYFSSGVIQGTEYIETTEILGIV